MSIGQAFATKVAPVSVRAKLITRNIGMFLAADMRPFTTVDSQYFRAMIATLEPARTTFATKVIPDLYEEVKSAVIDELKNAKTVAVTTDGWTPRATESYVTITAHYISPEWQLKSCVLQTRLLHASHTGVNIAAVLVGSLIEWEPWLPHQLQPIITDNAANMVVAVREASMAPHIACFAHTVNLAAQKPLDIPQVQRLQGPIRIVVSFLQKSTTATHLLSEKHKLLSIPSHKLINDVKTRWNSTYDMVTRYVEQQWAIAATLQCPELQKQSVHTLNNTDVILAQLLPTVLEPLKTVTVIMCNDHQPTLSMVWPLPHNLKQADEDEGWESSRSYSEGERINLGRSKW